MMTCSTEVTEAAGAVTATDGPPLAKPIHWFEQLTASDTDVAGGKGANLGELVSFGMPVPPGFVLTADAFHQFLHSSGLLQVILNQLATLDVDDTEALKQAAAEIQDRVCGAAIPTDLRQAVQNAYCELARRCEADQPFVAVRSSATTEDMPGTSFAGMNETFLNVRGEADLLEAIQGYWVSLYAPRVLFYRRKQGIPEENMAIAVVVQVMIPSEAAGVMFTVNPADNDRRTLVIEGACGLGDTVVSGAVSPDHWEINKDTLEITRERIAEKHILAYRDAKGRNQRRDLSPAEGSRPSLTEPLVRQIAELGRRIEEHYRSPQDIEWAVESGQISVVQSRPVTALGAEAGADEALARGLPASPGTATGVARLLQTLEDSEKLQPGEVLVTRKTEPDWVPLMRRASAIVTDEGGMTAHAAIVSRELGIPCVASGQRSEPHPDPGGQPCLPA